MKLVSMRKFPRISKQLSLTSYLHIDNKINIDNEKLVYVCESDLTLERTKNFFILFMEQF